VEVLIVFRRGLRPPQIILYFFSHFPSKVLHYPLTPCFPQIPKPCIHLRFILPMLVISQCSQLNSLSRFRVIKSAFSAHHRWSVFNARHRWSVFSARHRSSALLIDQCSSPSRYELCELDCHIGSIVKL